MSHFKNPKKFGNVVELYTQKDTIVDKCNIYLIKGTERTVLIDTGSGANDSNPDALYEGNISHVFLTHWHWDHSGGAHYFDQGIHIHKEDLDALMRGTIEDENLGRYFYDERYRFQAPRNPPAGINVNMPLPLGGSATLTPYWTPGHTPGSCVFLYRSDDANYLFTGDTLYAQHVSPFFSESRRDDWIGSLDFIERLCEENGVTIVFGGHYAPLRGLNAIKAQVAKQKSVLGKKRLKMGTCLNCYRTLMGEDMKACSGCMWATYCGEVCAENHWIQNHYKKCEI